MIPKLEVSTATTANSLLYIEAADTAAFLHLLSEKSPEGMVIVTDEVIAQLPYYTKAVSGLVSLLKTIILPAGEANKSWQHIAEMGASRGTVLVSIGGGVVSDMVGFVAAIYRRGMPFYSIPTTLLAQIDASIGGKNGINMPYAKNAVGTFYAPKAVMIDIEWLTSLPQREFNAGLAEMVKYGLIADAAFYAKLEQNVHKLALKEKAFLEKAILRCCEIKAAVVEADEKEERGVRQILNFGHTLGHAIEAATQYQQFLHGEAVAVGMVQAARLSHIQGFISAEELQRIIGLLRHLGLPTEVPDLSSESLMAFMQQDKKNERCVTKIVLLEKIGRAAVFSGFSARELL